MHFSQEQASRKGMTIVETVIALLCFAVVVGALASLAFTVKQSSDLSRDHYVAVNLAKNRIERMKTHDFEQLYEFIENQVRVNVNGLPDANGTFKRTTSVSVAGPDLVEATVTIDIYNRNKAIFAPGAETVSTYIAKIKPPPAP